MHTWLTLVNQPPRAHQVDDTQITLKFKHGLHTICIIAGLDWDFSHLNSELLSILQDRYPEGLSARDDELGAITTTPVPGPGDEATVKLVYGIPKNKSPDDLKPTSSEDWVELQYQDTDKIKDHRKLKDMSDVAFLLLDADDDGENVEWIVNTPTLDNEET
ncbi:hypothetical protein B0H63DRAFT_443159 [Podospora didyma]|uniref:Uncharacterized protein n=1 Tax=Podospora didyma TaxID=330526 RepID=A0AAE0P3V1_9PEZI|nr:hypothetical protein B0H63DRAFT_443159 [Podospora didyma]